MTKPHIIVTITGETFTEVHEAILALAQSVGGGANIESIAVATDTPEAKVAVKKTRSKAKPEVSPATADADILAAASEPTPDVENVVKGKTPDEARAEGIAAAQSFFAENSNSMPAIRKLTEKFGVDKFADIPDDRAFEFLADVKLLVAGAGEAA